MMDRLNCLKRAPKKPAGNAKKVCLYQDESKKNLKRRRQSKVGCKPGFHLHQSNDSTTVRDSMQYYRVWIYSCNAVLGLASVIFIIFAAFLLADVRLSLLRGFELYHPTFLYAYTALILQCGIVQTVGCLGAQRLSHKLLSIYWILLLILTLGDVIVGLVWVFKLDEVKLGLRPSLTKQFLSKYSIDGHFTKVWNLVQAQEHCCGVDGPIDFDKFITSSIIKNLEAHHVLENESSSSSSSSSASTLAPSLTSFYLALPESCCMTISVPMTANSFPIPIQKSDQSTTVDHPQPGHNPYSNSMVKRQTPHLPNASSEEQLVYYGSRFVNSKQLNRYHHLRHFIHHESKKSPHPQYSLNQSEADSDGAGANVNSGEPVVLGESSGPMAESNRQDDLIELLIPFSCGNPTHNQANHHHHLNNPSTSFTKALRKNPSRRSVPSDVAEMNQNQNRPPAAFIFATPPSSASAVTLTNEPEPDSDSDSAQNSRTRVKKPKRHVPPFSSAASPAQLFKNKVRIYRNGCYLKLHQWLDHVSGLLFIFGFCVIGFVKICFLIILRYEIREMIEKIHLLETEGSADGVGFNSSSPLLSRSSIGLNLLQKQHSLQSNSYNLVGGGGPPSCGGHFNTGMGITIKSPELSTSSPFINHCAPLAHLYHHHHHLPPHYSQQHRHSTTPYWNQHHRGSHCGGSGPMGMGTIIGINSSGLVGGGGGGACGGGGGGGAGGCNGRRRPSGRSLNEMDIGLNGTLNTLALGPGDICCSNHSQETVNMTLLITTPTRRESASQNDDEIHETCIGGGGAEGHGRGHENISLKVPVKTNSSSSSPAGGHCGPAADEDYDLDQHELRRSHFANHYCTWDSNVSCDSSASNIALDGSVCGGGGGGPGIGRDHSASSSVTGLLVHVGPVLLAGNTQLVKVDMENHRDRDVGGINESLSPTNLQFIDEDQEQPLTMTTTNNRGFSNNPSITYDIEDNRPFEDGGASESLGAGASNNESVIVNVEAEAEAEAEAGDSSSTGSSSRHRLRRQPQSLDNTVGSLGGAVRLLAHANSASSSSSNGTTSGLRRNGNNNSVDSGQSVDSDYIMSFIGTSV